jgi:putative SOS response-associated peptidase YedK
MKLPGRGLSPLGVAPSRLAPHATPRRGRFPFGAMMITAPNKYVSKIHDRMPVLLSENQFEPWLPRKAGTEILRPVGNGVVVMRPVSTRVNSSRADDSDPTLIDAVAA